MKKLNEQVTEFLDALKHPLRKEIEQLRQIIIRANSGLSENIKWNGPNYDYEGEDRITMRIQPPKQIQLVFHRGAKKIEVPKSRLISDDDALLDWKANDRAVFNFKNMDAINNYQPALTKIINAWLDAAS